MYSVLVRQSDALMGEPLLQGGLALCLFLTELMVDGLAFAFGSHVLGHELAKLVAQIFYLLAELGLTEVVARLRFATAMEGVELCRAFCAELLHPLAEEEIQLQNGGGDVAGCYGVFEVV